MEEARNHLLLTGTVVESPILSHENHGRKFYRFPLAVSRLSGQTDTVQVIAPDRKISEQFPLAGDRVSLEGQLRSFNNRSGSGNRLVLSAFPHMIVPAVGEDENRIVLTGVLCKPPVLRRTPLGRCICDMMLAVNRKYGRSDYLPCIAWGQVAMTAGMLTTGESLSLEGRLQSREYTKAVDGKEERRTAYEVSIMHLLDGNTAAE